MYYTANRILRNSSDAEDVVHQAFLKVIEILDTISSPRCHKTRALLVTITEHKAIDLYREKQRRNVLPLAEEYIGAAPTRSCRPPNGLCGRIPQDGRAPRASLPDG